MTGDTGSSGMRVLLVDDEPSLLDVGKLFLEKGGPMRVETALSAVAALERPDLLSFDAIVADYEMPGQNGIDLLKAVRERDSSIPFIIFTGRGREEVVIEAINNGVDFYVQKGGSPRAQFAELAHKIRSAVERRQAQEALRLDEMRLEALFTLSQMHDVPVPEMMHFALEEGIRLTGSAIGYVAFVNDDETELEMYAWSESAMEGCHIRDKPQFYPLETTGLWGEAVRQRRPVITNDYAADNPLKKGYPPGHVQLSRHMNVPVFDGKRIVLVAGVGNKAQPYDDADVRQLSLLMGGMWQIIKRRRSEEELQHVNDEISAACEQLKATEEMLLAQNAELAEAEAALRESEERMMLAADGANIGIWDLNIVTGEEVTNEKSAEMLGYAPVERITMEHEWRNLVHPDDLPRIIQATQGHFAGLLPYYDVECRMKCSDGSWKWIHSVGRVSERDEAGRPLRMTGIQQDITEMKRYREQLEEANKKLILLSDITRHDILNQVTAVLGYIFMLKEDWPDTGKPARYIAAIEELTRTIEDQISFTREYQELGVHAPVWQPLSGLIRRASRGAGLDGIEVADETGTTEILADPMFEKVLRNIFTNAIAHGGPVTRILIRFTVEEGAGVLSVADNGIGVPDELKETIFKRGFGRKTGFGLFLVREILLVHGMTICEAGHEGSGAVFKITIPRDAFRPVPPAP
ncbi:MAG: GAF domain-containing protein [Methanomicrobiales archaeon]|nr:GAF domain-containing protein [Methanomicrobiales archaeon]